MTTLIADAELLAKLHNLEGLVEVRDPSGRTLGYFHPVVQAGNGGPVRSPFTDEEVQRRRQERTGRPLADILGRLGQP